MALAASGGNRLFEEFRQVSCVRGVADGAGLHFECAVWMLSGHIIGNRIVAGRAKVRPFLRKGRAAPRVVAVVAGIAHAFFKRRVDDVAPEKFFVLAAVGIVADSACDVRQIRPGVQGSQIVKIMALGAQFALRLQKQTFLVSDMRAVAKRAALVDSRMLDILPRRLADFFVAAGAQPVTLEEPADEPGTARRIVAGFALAFGKRLVLYRTREQCRLGASVRIVADGAL